MPRSIVAPFLYVVALPASLAACGSVELAPYDTSGGIGGGPAVTGTGGGSAVTGTGGAGANGEDASSTSSTGASTGPAPAPSCSAADCAVRIAEGAPKCAVSASGKVSCWWGGALLNERLAAAGPVEGLDDVVAASGSSLHMCFLHADGRVSCQGANLGQLGQAVPIGKRSAVPVVLPDVEGVVQLASGEHHICGLLGSGNVICWGKSTYVPLLGVKGVEQTAVPVTVTGLDDAVQVAISFEHTCALRATGEVVCWGALTTGGAAVTPVRVEGIEGAVEITTGWNHDCARLASGKVLCWGNNEQSQLGDGTSEPRSEPVEVLGLDDAIQVSAGSRETCALRQGGKVVCWGTTPQEIDIPEAVYVSVGVVGVIYDDACAALASGEIACWSTPAGRDIVVFGP
ncbi:RCC1 domain-containing protein [Sorangium sp. So ce1128]